MAAPPPSDSAEAAAAAKGDQTHPHLRRYLQFGPPLISVIRHNAENFQRHPRKSLAEIDKAVGTIMMLLLSASSEVDACAGGPPLNPSAFVDQVTRLRARINILRSNFEPENERFRLALQAVSQDTATFVFHIESTLSAIAQTLFQQ